MRTESGIDTENRKAMRLVGLATQWYDIAERRENLGSRLVLQMMASRFLERARDVSAQPDVPPKDFREQRILTMTGINAFGDAMDGSDLPKTAYERQLLSELKSLRVENARLREALLPFARVAKSYDDFMPLAMPNKGGEFLFPLLDSNGAHYMVGIGEEDFRCAASVLGERG